MQVPCMCLMTKMNWISIFVGWHIGGDFDCLAAFLYTLMMRHIGVMKEKQICYASWQTNGPRWRKTMFENSRHNDYQPIYGIFTKIYLKQNKNKIKVVGRKTQSEKFRCFQESNHTSFVPPKKGKCRLKAKIIYYWINLYNN